MEQMITETRQRYTNRRCRRRYEPDGKSKRDEKIGTDDAIKRKISFFLYNRI